MPPVLFKRFFAIIAIAIILSTPNVNASTIDDRGEKILSDIKEVALEVTSTATNDNEKTTEIFNWIAQNIKYDTLGVKNNVWSTYTSAEAIMIDTYDKRKGVCTGYAYLFKRMLEYNGIKSEVISGYARNGLSTYSLAKPNHDWNAVFIDNQWKLFDVTWASATDIEANDNPWYNVDPNKFILSHYPKQADLAFTDKKYTLNDFFSFPIYTTGYYTLGLEKETSFEGTYKATNNKVRIFIKPQDHDNITAKVYSIVNKKWYYPEITDKAYEQGFIEFSLEEVGKNIVVIGAAKNTDRGFSLYNNLIIYTVNNS